MDNNEKQIYLDFLITKEEIDNLVIPYIDLETETGYSVKIKKTLVPNYYLVNDKLIQVYEGEDNMIYAFADQPSFYVLYKDGAFYINNGLADGFIE